jgi:dsDNA-specific endonuclease/ATPase MutS2
MNRGLDPFEITIEDTIDLHSFLPAEVAELVEEYVFLAKNKGFSEIRIIHGRGIGVQRQIIHSILKRHPLVIRFYDSPDRGSTSVILKK